MSDTPQFTAEPVPHIRVLAQYAKRATFTSADGIQTVGLKEAPNIELGIDLQSVPLEGESNVFETILTLMGRAVVDGKAAFEVDLAYAGIFDLSGTPAEHVDRVLMIDCPQLLFPFARRLVAELSREGGFPPLLIDPIDFPTLYRNQIEQNRSGS